MACVVPVEEFAARRFPACSNLARPEREQRSLSSKEEE